MENKNIHKIGKELFITSDEEIKEGDWCLGKENYPTRNWNSIEGFKESYKKIILTTDFRLAPDVQKIDDEFLEWFVKNPSCESVEVERLEDGQYFDYLEDNSVIEGIYENYKIIIPQEEPKQTLEKYSERFDNKDNELVQGVFNPDTWGKRLVEEPKQEPTMVDKLKYYFENTPKEQIDKDWEESCKKTEGINSPTVDEFIKAQEQFIKQETTLEEVAEKYLQEWRLLNNIHLSNVIHAERCKNDFIAGAKWQQERSYSEEDMQRAFMEGHNICRCVTDNIDETKECFIEWFEQFKKK